MKIRLSYSFNLDDETMRLLKKRFGVQANRELRRHLWAHVDLMIDAFIAEATYEVEDHQTMPEIG